jgi:acyl-CoA thioester hydrolase
MGAADGRRPPNNFGIHPTRHFPDMSEDPIETRARYRHFLEIQTRWSDNDIYGHVNNVTYYSYFDTVVNCYLIDQGGLDIRNGAVIGVAVETMCRFRKPVTYPECVEAGLRVGTLGNSSVRYEIGIFRQGEDEAAASGHFVHVFVDRAENRPVPIPGPIRDALRRIQAAK